MIIKIKNLRTRGIIGIYDWEQNHAQDIIVNVSMEFDAGRAISSDKIEDTVDYKKIKKLILEIIETRSFSLIEKMADTVLQVIMSDPKVMKATVEIDKPHALRFADSVSVTHTAEKS